MLALTILSPHRDDAAFSLYLALRYWTRLPIPLRVVNFFTISEYAPHAAACSQRSVSTLRRREDQLVLSSLHRAIRIESLDLLDAPIRLGISSDDIAKPESAARQPAAEISELAIQINNYFAQGLVLAPLALGNHVDHLAVHAAAIESSRPHKLGFYEDLPYATWTSNASLRDRLTEVERSTHTGLKPHVVRSAGMGVSQKYRAITRYKSQITRSEALTIARFASKYRVGERIWLPKYSASWRPLIH